MLQKFISKKRITVDTDHRPRPSENVGDLRTIYVADRMEASCLWLPIKPISTFSYFEEVAEMLVGPDILWPPGFVGDDADGDIDVEDSDDSDDDMVDMIEDNHFPAINLEPVCVIQ